MESSKVRPWIFLLRKIGEFTRDYSHVCFEIYSADSDDLKRSLDENKLDICVLLEPVESAKYIQTPIPSRIDGVL